MSLCKTYLSFLFLATVVIAGCKKDDKAPPPPTAPVVSTAALTNITTTGATAGGSIVSDGGDTITASGIVWSETNAMPTLSDSIVAGSTTSGTFTVNISGLDFDKSYYIRAFATNSVGTGYGEVVTLSTVNDTNKVRFTYNGAEVVYGIIVSPTTGKKWLDRNLGAKQVATAFDDFNAYGDLFQWGRPDDGHQLMNWTSSTEGAPVNETTTTLATSDVPAHSNFILCDLSGATPLNGDWRPDNNRSRWATNPQGPCPSGWHVPTRNEWAAEVSVNSAADGGPRGGTATSGGMKDMLTAFNQLKLTVPSWRASDDGGRLFDALAGGVGNLGRYWCNEDEQLSIDPLFYGGRSVFFGSNFFVPIAANINADGLSVRCIKD